MASIGIFLPVYFFTIIPAPWFKRHRDNPQLKAFVDGATAAATGAITGAVLVLGRARDHRRADSVDRARQPGGPLALQNPRADNCFSRRAIVGLILYPILH